MTYYSVNLSWVSGFDMGSTQHFIVMKLVGSTYIQVHIKNVGKKVTGKKVMEKKSHSFCRKKSHKKKSHIKKKK